MAPRDLEGDGSKKSVTDGNVNAAKEIHYIGVRKRKSGRYGAEIRDPLRKCHVWLGTWDTAEAAAKEYDRAAKVLKAPNAKINFPSPDNLRCGTQGQSAVLERWTAIHQVLASATTTSVTVPPLILAVRKLNLDKKINNKLEKEKPWTHHFLNDGVGMQKVGNERVTTNNCNQNPQRNPTFSFNLVGYGADLLQQPPVAMAVSLFGMNVGTQINPPQGHEFVGAASGPKNLLHATSYCDYFSTSRAMDTQLFPPDVKKATMASLDMNLPLLPPEVKKATMQYLDLNLPTEEDDLPLLPPEVKKGTMQSLDLNLPTEEDDLPLLPREVKKATMQFLDLNLPTEEDDEDRQLSISIPAMKTLFPAEEDDEDTQPSVSLPAMKTLFPLGFDLNLPAPAEKDY